MKNKIFGTPFWLQCPGQKNIRKVVFFDSLEEQFEFKNICSPSAEPINFAYHPTRITQVKVKTLSIHRMIYFKYTSRFFILKFARTNQFRITIDSLQLVLMLNLALKICSFELNCNLFILKD